MSFVLVSLKSDQLLIINSTTIRSSSRSSSCGSSRSRSTATTGLVLITTYNLQVGMVAPTQPSSVLQNYFLHLVAANRSCHWHGLAVNISNQCLAIFQINALLLSFKEYDGKYLNQIMGSYIFESIFKFPVGHCCQPCHLECSRPPRFITCT